MPRSFLDHAVTIRAVLLCTAPQETKHAVCLSLVTLTTATAIIGQNFTWQKRMQLFWDWDPNHAHEGVQGASAHVQVCFIANPLSS